MRYRDMFTAELGEAVVGADEEVVAADVVIVIIRRAVQWRTDGAVECVLSVAAWVPRVWSVCLV